VAYATAHAVHQLTHHGQANSLAAFMSTEEGQEDLSLQPCWPARGDALERGTTGKPALAPGVPSMISNGYLPILAALEGSMASVSNSARRRTTNVLLRYRDRDSPFAVSRQTATRLSDQLGLTETQVIHLALAELAAKHLPQYPADDGPVSAKAQSAIRKRIPRRKMVATQRLF
jgi:hypothetical protein